MSEKLLKAEFTFLRNCDDSGAEVIVKRFIEGAELAKWLSFNEKVALFADAHNANPNWQSIKWVEDIVGKFDHTDD